MKVTIRIDDITPDMNWHNFDRVMDILKQNQIKPLLGIVPNNQDPLLSFQEPDPHFADKMIQLQKEGVVLAMHGATHVYQTKKAGLFPLNCFSEFAGVTFSEQSSKLTGAKQQLEEMGIHTDIFMAPGHTFDKNTVKILRDLDFQYITDGFGWKPYKRLEMTFLPIALQKKKVFAERDGVSTIVLHVNQWDEKDFTAFENMLQTKKQYFSDYAVWFEKQPKKQNAFNIVKEYISAKGKWFLVYLKTKMGK